MTAGPRDLQQRIRPDIQSMHAYEVQPSAGLIKLDAMENHTGFRRNCRRNSGSASALRR